MGLIYGEYPGRSDEFQPGGASYECGSKNPHIMVNACLVSNSMADNDFKVVPHGVAYEQFKEASENPPPVEQISNGAIAVMFESSRPFTITEYAWNSKKLHEHDATMWDDLVGKD